MSNNNARHRTLTPSEEQTNREFLHLRIKITLITTIMFVLVLSVVFATFTLSDYSSKVNSIQEVLINSIDAFALDEDDDELHLVDGVKVIDETDDESMLIGEGSSFETESYIPIAFYKADYENSQLVLLRKASTTITEDAMQKGLNSFLQVEPGFYQVEDASLVLMKEHFPNGDYFAFTDISVLQRYIDNYIRLFCSIVVLVTFAVCLIMWSMTNWVLRPLKESWRRQRIFISNASHELKTPLTIIRANLQMIVDETYKDKETKEELVQTSLIETERMTELVKALLDIATEKAYVVEKEDIDFSELVSKQSMLFDARAFETGNFIDDSRIDTDIVIHANQDNMERLLSILLDNACKYSTDNTTIEIKLEKEKKNAVLTITNEGEDIPDDMREEIFERFVRMDEARTGNANASSYGLGLAMARDIVDAAGGKISVKSGMGKISFIVCVPIIKTR